MSDIKGYDKSIEDLFINFLFSDPELFVRCKGIVDPSYFEDTKNKTTISTLMEYSNKYNSLPSIEQVKSLCKKTDIELLSDISDSHRNWFLDEFETFCRHKALENVILDSIEMIKDKRYGEVEKSVKEAVQIGLVRNLGLDYFEDPKARLERIKQNDGLISTGWETVDSKLFGGFNKGGLHIFAGQSGSGKSVVMQNLTVNWALNGLNTVYVTLELSEDLCAMRIDAMTSGVNTRYILRDLDDVAIKVRNIAKTNKGTIRIKQMRNGSTANDILSFIKEYQIQTGVKVDAIAVDYLDLMMPGSVKVGVSDAFVKDKYVSEELRNLAIDLDCILLTASQLNRNSYESTDYDGASVAGGISKLNTADNMLAIFTTPSMKESGRYQFQFMKTRSSSGVGTKVDMAYNPETLRITDLEDDDEDEADTMTTTRLLHNLKNKSKSSKGNNSKATDDSEQDDESETSESEDLMNKIKSIRHIVKR